MNQKAPKAVQFWTDSQFVVSGNPCRLIDNKSKKNIFKFDTGPVLNAFAKLYSFLCYGGIA